MNSSKFTHFYRLILPLLMTKIHCGQGVDLTSTLYSTKRGFACPNETVVVTCSGGIGTELQWHYNGTLQFLFDDNTAELPDAILYRVNSTPVLAYLSHRTSAGNETFLYTSHLSIAGIKFDFVYINCTVRSSSTIDIDVRSLIIRRSASPSDSVLKRGQLECMGQGANTSQYLLEWENPDNINLFDLDHYEVKITSPNTKFNKTLLCVNTSAIISFDHTTILDVVSVNVSIMAVNQCGQRGFATERLIGLGECPSSVSCSINLKFSPLWVLWLIAYFDSIFTH